MFGVYLLAIETVRGHGEDSVHGIWVGEGDETKSTGNDTWVKRPKKDLLSETAE